MRRLLPAGCSVTAVGALIGALLFGGGAPRAAPAGLPDAGPATGWGLFLLRLAAYGATTLMAGSLLAAACLLPRSGDRLTSAGRRALRWASVSAAVLAAAALLQLLLCLAWIDGVPPVRVFHPAALAAFAATTPQGWSFTLQAAFGCVVAVAGPGRRTGNAAFWLLPFSLGAAAVPVLAGHAATPTDPFHLSALTLLAHVLAATLWAGGLAALTITALRSTGALAAALPRFSPLALWCAIAVGAGGVATALLHAGSPGTLAGTGYGRLLALKIFAFCGLVCFGHLHRRRSLSSPTREVFVRLASAELLLMAATFGLAVALSQTPPP